MGKAENESLNLFFDSKSQSSFFLVSEKDCVQFDPVAVHAEYCTKRPACEKGHVAGLTYLGRFDWMNGNDPPKGTFGMAFRFLPLEDAWESGSCPKKPTP